MGNQINEAAGILRHELKTLGSAGGRSQKDCIESSGTHGCYVCPGFFDAGIGEQAAIYTGGFGVSREALQTVANDGIQISEQQQRNLGALADLARDVQHFRHRRAGA